jgi:possible type I restriction-modification system, S subunit
MENRYDKYKDSGIAWIGEIPEHWEVIKTKNAFNIISGATPKTDNIAYWDGEITWITPADYKTEDIIIKSGKRNITTEGLNSCGTSIVPQGSIIFSKRAPIGLVAINAVPLCTNQGCISCIPKPYVNTKYFYYLMSVLTEWFELFGSGTTFKELSTNNFANFSLSQPSFTEQQSIATYLDQKCSEIDELIILQEEMITKLQSYKQSVITEAVTKGLDKNVPLKDSGIEWIGEIPEHWICTVFKKFLSEPMQYGANEPAEECNYNDPRYIRITDIKDDGTLRDDTFKSLPLEKAKEYMLTKGDLLFARSGATVGKTFLYKEDYAACFAGYLIKARCNKNELLPNFVFYYTLSNVYQNWKNSIFIQSTIQNIGADKYSVMPIIIPPLSEQQSIADYLDRKCSEIDELISIKQQKIEKLKDYKKSLIFECVTGKRKV